MYSHCRLYSWRTHQFRRMRRRHHRHLLNFSRGADSTYFRPSTITHRNVFPAGTLNKTNYRKAPPSAAKAANEDTTLCQENGCMCPNILYLSLFTMTIVASTITIFLLQFIHYTFSTKTPNKPVIAVLILTLDTILSQYIKLSPPSTNIS